MTRLLVVRPRRKEVYKKLTKLMWYLRYDIKTPPRYWYSRAGWTIEEWEVYLYHLYGKKIAPRQSHIFTNTTPREALEQMFQAEIYVKERDILPSTMATYALGLEQHGPEGKSNFIRPLDEDGNPIWTFNFDIMQDFFPWFSTRMTSWEEFERKYIDRHGHFGPESSVSSSGRVPQPGLVRREFPSGSPWSHLLVGGHPSGRRDSDAESFRSPEGYWDHPLRPVRPLTG